jgi:threonylcarbamoyladenosine tRNA methylthiotransferase MtaB
MRRRYRARHYEDRLRITRQLMPDAAIGADVMVGFPGESDSDFERTRAFIARMPFTYLHVFTYSMREGTEAAEHGDQIPKAVKKDRNRVLRELIAKKNLTFRESFVGRELSAVSLSSRDDSSRVLTDNFIHVELNGSKLSPGRMVSVSISEVDGERTLGAVGSSRGLTD